MKRVTITGHVYSDSVGNEWKNAHAATEAYAHFLSEKLTAALEQAGITAEIDICTPRNVTGYARWDVEGEDYETEQAANDILETVGERAWSEFCCSDVAASL